MNVAFPFFLLALLVHIAIFLTSARRDRGKRAVLGILLLTLGWPLLILAGLPPLQEGGAPAWLRGLLASGRYYMPFASFLVYLRK